MKSMGIDISKAYKGKAHKHKPQGAAEEDDCIEDSIGESLFHYLLASNSQ